MAGAIERVFVAPPIPTGGGKVIAAPFQFYTTGEDNLRIVSLNSIVGVTLKVQARLVNSKGELQAASWDHTPNSDRTAASSILPLAPGAVLNLTVFANTGSPKVGQTFVIVQLIRGLGAASIVLGTLLQGYVTAQQALAWPGSPCVSSTDGEPAVRNILGATPAAGVGAIETCPTGARWELVSVCVNFVTSAVAGARFPLIQIGTAVGVGAVVPAPNAAGIGPTVSQRYTWGQNLPLNTLQPNAALSLPQRQFLLGGDSFSLGATGIQAGDQFSAPVYQVREWLEAA